MRYKHPLWTLIRTEKRWLMLGTIAMLINSLGTLSLPALIEQMLAESPSSNTLLLIGVLSLVSAAAAGARAASFGIASERVVAGLRCRTFAGLLRQPSSALDQTAGGSMVSRLTRDAAAVQDIVNSQIGPMLRSAVVVVGGLALMVWKSPKLTILTVAILPPILIATRLYGRGLRALARKTSDAVATSTAVAEESLRNHRTVKLFRAQQLVQARYDEQAQRACALGVRRATAQGRFAAGSVAGRFGGLAMVIGFGASRVQSEVMTTAELGAFLVYALMVAVAFGELAQGWGAFQRTLGAAERCVAFLATEAQPRSAATLPQRVPEIAFRSVRFAYPSRPDTDVFTDLNLTLRRGEVTAVVGPSGAGKSTLIDLICGLYAPRSGQVSWNGVDVTTVDPDELRRRVGVVAQASALFDGTVRENLRVADPHATEEQLWDVLDAAELSTFVRQLPDGLDTPLGPDGVALSGGQRQRICIARALLTEPDLLVLDEATSALDEECAERIRETLSRVSRGRTVLLITHRAETAAGADRTIHLTPPLQAPPQESSAA